MLDNSTIILMYCNKFEAWWEAIEIMNISNEYHSSQSTEVLMIKKIKYAMQKHRFFSMYMARTCVTFALIYLFHLLCRSNDPSHLSFHLPLYLLHIYCSSPGTLAGFHCLH